MARLVAFKKIVADLKAAGKKINNELKENEAKFERGTISRMGFEAKRDQLTQQYQEKVEQAKKQVDEMQKKYEQDVKNWGSLDGGKLDSATITLLNSGLKLNREDYAGLEAKFAGNYTMLRAIQEKAKSTLGGRYVSEFNIDVQEKVKVFNEIAKTAQDIINSMPLAKIEETFNQSYMARLWEHEGAFEQSYAQHEQIVQLDEQASETSK